MQLESINNACKTPNLAVCILLTLTKCECIWETQTLKSGEIKDQSNEIIKNNLKINEDTCMSSKNARRIETCNWHQT